MSYPSPTTINQLNLKDIDASIKWTPYLGQMLSLLSFVPNPNASGKLLSNKANTLFALTPSSRGSSLPKHVVDTTLVTEAFERFGDLCILDLGDVVMANGVDLLTQQISSIGVRILREFNNMFFNGNGFSPNLKGLNLRADTTINMGGGKITLNVIYQLKNSITSSSQEGLGFGGNLFCSHSLLFRQFLELLAGKAVKVDWIKHPKLNIRVCSVFGMLWIVDDNISIAGGLSTLYALNLDAIRVLYACSEEYSTNEWGMFYLPVPMNNSISEFGGLLMAIWAIQNLPNAIGRVINIKV